MKLRFAISIATVATMTLLSASAQEQTPPSPPATAHPAASNRLAQVAVELKLTDAQRAQLKAALQNMRTEVQRIRDDTSLSQDQRRQKMREARQETLRTVKGILTPEQFAKWQQIRSNRKQPHG